MAKRIEARLLEPHYVQGVIVPYLGPKSRVWLAIGEYDDDGPLETADDVVKQARKWQRKRNRLDQTPGVVNSEMKPDSTALQQGADSA